jgi:hypothetical protein
MNFRGVLTTLLLLFVGVSLAALVARDLREQRPTAAVPLADGVAAIYFHGKLDCSTCRTIESYARGAVAQGFAGQLERGALTWREVDFDEPRNAHFKQDFNLVATALVLVDVRGGRPERWTVLPEVWNLTGDKAKFFQYVQAELRRFLQPHG